MPQIRFDFLVTLVLLGTLFPAFPATAQESQSTLKSADLEESPAKQLGDEVDAMITNPLLRAESGSTSRWSIASEFSYSGGSLQSPLAADRPNISATSGTIPYALMDGQISVKYNISVAHSVMGGVGIRWITPFQGLKKPAAYDGDKMDTDNPYLIYQYLYKFAGIQAVLQATGTYYTNTNLVAEGYVSNFNVEQDNIYQVGTTKLSLGVDLIAQYGWYNKTGPGAGFDDVREDQSDYAFQLIPVIEYQFNDRFNFRAVTNLWSYEHMRITPNPNTYHFDTITQSVGLGWSVTRDIFLYPNLQFLPENIRSDLTNVAVNANINLF